MRDRVQIRFGLGQSHRRCESGDDAQEVRSPIRPSRIALQRHRHRELGFTEGKQKAPVQHADDRIRRTVQRNVLTDKGRVAAESALPQSMGEDGDPPLASFIIRLQCPAKRGTRSEQFEELPETRTPSSRSGVPMPVRFVVQFVKTASPARLDASCR